MCVCVCVCVILAKHSSHSAFASVPMLTFIATITARDLRYSVLAWAVLAMQAPIDDAVASLVHWNVVTKVRSCLFYDCNTTPLGTHDTYRIVMHACILQVLIPRCL